MFRWRGFWDEIAAICGKTSTVGMVAPGDGGMVLVVAGVRMWSSSGGGGTWWWDSDGGGDVGGGVVIVVVRVRVSYLASMWDRNNTPRFEEPTSSLVGGTSKGRAALIPIVEPSVVWCSSRHF
ncbi:hypothetical protein Tco_0195812 [Tanacetum coccineum]